MRAVAVNVKRVVRRSINGAILLLTQALAALTLHDLNRKLAFLTPIPAVPAAAVAVINKEPTP
jgi:hypothetical protein